MAGARRPYEALSDDKPPFVDILSPDDTCVICNQRREADDVDPPPLVIVPVFTLQRKPPRQALFSPHRTDHMGGYNVDRVHRECMRDKHVATKSAAESAMNDATLQSVIKYKPMALALRSFIYTTVYNGVNHLSRVTPVMALDTEFRLPPESDALQLHPIAHMLLTSNFVLPAGFVFPPAISCTLRNVTDRAADEPLAKLYEYAPLAHYFITTFSLRVSARADGIGDEYKGIARFVADTVRDKVKHRSCSVIGIQQSHAGVVIHGVFIHNAHDTAAAVQLQVDVDQFVQDALQADKYSVDMETQHTPLLNLDQSMAFSYNTAAAPGSYCVAIQEGHQAPFLLVYDTAMLHPVVVDQRAEVTEGEVQKLQGNHGHRVPVSFYHFVDW
jgi:hypothetical protein